MTKEFFIHLPSRIGLMCILMSLCWQPVVAQDRIGVAAAVNQNTSDLTLEEERKLVEAGYKIIQNHTIETDNVGKAQMLLIDGTAITIGPNSSVTLDRFIYNAETAEGSLEMTSRGLLRLVGGKVTKKKPAIIRTNSATVGIRGGITIVNSVNQKTTAAFIYGDEMRVVPTQNAAGDIVLTENGFVVIVEDPTSDIDIPQVLTTDMLNAFQASLVSSKEEEEEGSEGDTDGDENSEEESEEESSEESEEESSDEASSDEESETEANDDTETEEANEESGSTDDSSETETSTETKSQPQVNEGALDSSGISDNSSQAAPDTLSVADDFAGEINVEVEVETGEVETQEVAQETTQVASETTVERKATNTVQVTQVFETVLTQNLLTIDENSLTSTVANIAIDNPSEIAYTVQLAGFGSELFSYDQESNDLIYNGNANYESNQSFALTIIYTKENNDIVMVPIRIAVNNLDEAPELLGALAAVNFAENLAIGTTVINTSAVDPEAATVNFSLSGEGSDKFTIANDGTVTLNSALDYETKNNYNLIITASDGTQSTSTAMTVSLTDVNEAHSVNVALADTTITETSTVDTIVATTAVIDPEGGTINYALSGTDSAQFSIDSNGTIKLASLLDYETKTDYSVNVETTVDGITVTEVLSLSVANTNEAPTLTSNLAAVTFAETSAVGTTVVTASASDPESASITYSLSGTDAAKFSIASNGTVTIASALDYETKTSYSINVNVSDGSNSVSTALTIPVTNVNEAPSLSSDLSATNFTESSAVGTTVITSSASDPESASITYSLSGTDAAKFSIASNGTVTIASALDYETKTSYSINVNVSDGSNSVSTALTIPVTNVPLENPVIAIQNTPFVESNANDTSVATVSSIDNSTSETLVYTISGTGSNKFSVNSSSGAITNSATLDFEEAKSYNLTLTATGQTSGDTGASVITVPVKNVEELHSTTLRYSAAAINPSRSGFSATATRGGGPSGINLAAYQQEQVITTAQSSATNKTLADYDNIGSDAVHTPVSIVTGDGQESVAVDNLDFRYFYPIGVESGLGQFQFSPGRAALDGHYKTVDAQSEVVANIAQSEVLSAGRFDSKLFWMTLDKDAQTLNYSAQQEGAGDIDVLMFHNYSSSTILVGSDRGWQKLVTDKGYDFTHRFDTTMGMEHYTQSQLNEYEIIIDMRLSLVGPPDTGSSTEQTLLENWMKDSGSNLWIKIYGENLRNANSQNSVITSKTNEFLNNVGAHITLSGSIEEDSNSGTQGGIVDAGLFGSGNFYEGLNGFIIDPDGMAPRLSHIKDLSNNNIGQLLFNKAPRDNDANLYAAGYIRANELESGVNSDIFLYGDVNGVGGTSDSYNNSNNAAIANWLLDQGVESSYIGTQYHSYLDQVVLTGDVYTDAMYNSFTNNHKRVIALNVIPLENHTTSGTNSDFFYPAFLPSGFYDSSEMDFITLGPDYCAAVGNNASTCNTYANYYDWAEQVLDASENIDTARFGATNEMPEGTSQWYQVLNPAGKGVGLHAQLAIQDSYDGAGGSTTRDDQQSYLGVMINTMDKRANDVTRYSVGDTGQQLDGTHYWSYQKRTNADNDGLGVQLGTTPIECASSSDRGCLLAEDSTSDDRPMALMVTTADPYKTGDMGVAVKLDTNNEDWTMSTFNQMAISGEYRTVEGDSDANQDYKSISDFRSSDFYTSTATTYNGFFTGIMEFNGSGTGNDQLASVKSGSTLASINFDTTNDDVQVAAPLSVSTLPSNNYTNTWGTVDTGELVLNFGDADNTAAKSAYISNEVFAAELKDDGAQIDGSSGGANNLAGVMVSYDTLDKEDSDLFHTNGNDSMPNAEYATWGFWAMGAVDVSPNSGTQTGAVHLGTWVAGELVAANEIPTSGSASMSGAAIVKAAYRHNQTGTNYDVHKYTTTADVAATFNWGSSAYTGTLAVTNFDDKNPIVSNAGFTSFNVSLNSNNANTYTGTSTTTIQNGWSGGAVIAGALYGGDSVDETGGRINVSLHKSGSASDSGANDFYIAEGIYLLD